jgi:hypothetical protein
MNSLTNLLSRIFGLLAGLFWLATLAAVGWQIWYVLVDKATQMITVKMAFERLGGGVPAFTNDSIQVMVAIISALSLVLFFGLCALAFSALAKVLE